MLCRNNIRIDGIEEEQYETSDICEEKVQKATKEKFGIEGEDEIGCCHGLERNQSNSERKRPITIICKLLRFKDKQKEYSKLKKNNINIFI